MARLRAANEDNSMAVHYTFRKPREGNKDMAKLKEQANVDKQELSTLLHQRERVAEKERNRRRNESVNLISRALSEPSTATSTSNTTAGNRDFPAYTNTAIALNPLYNSSLDILNASKDLVADYNEIERIITHAVEEGAELDEAEDWRRELQEAERLIGLGKKKALRDVKRVLGAEVEDGDMMDVYSEGADGIRNDTDDHDNKIFSYEVNYELQKALRYAERGVKRMTKCLPRDDIGP